MTKMSRRNKVFWTESERAEIVTRAVDTQEERPDLSGLPLLRASMLVLPVNRRRKIAALTQVSWFEAGVKAERERRRSTHERESNPILPLIKETASEVHANGEMFTQFAHVLSMRHEEILPLLVRSLEALGQIQHEMRGINEKLDRIAPDESGCED